MDFAEYIIDVTYQLIFYDVLKHKLKYGTYRDIWEYKKDNDNILGGNPVF